MIPQFACRMVLRLSKSVSNINIYTPLKMKSKIFTFALVATFFNANAQNAAQSRIDGTIREQPAPVSGQNLNTQSNDNTEVTENDTGAQRPISLSKSGISSFFGYDSKILYRDNPLAQDNALSEYKTGVWTNTFLVVQR